MKSSAQVQLAEVYNQDSTVTISDYLVSEKYDGVRAIWTGEQLLTRQGNPIPAPNWFTAPLPAVWLDGELWTQRQDFETLSSIVRTQTANDDRWRQVSYMVFDMPDAQLPFEQRYKNYTDLIEQINAAHIKAIQQLRFDSNQALSEHLQALVESGAEGLMLHLASAHHRSGRSDALLKLKPYFDAEAEVIAHLPGQGKYTGMLGALRVRNQQGIEFSVGSGFTDAERANPPPIGSTITYKYHGYTNNGLPRFTSFLRVRGDRQHE
ncbi:DNA ligase [Nitrincola iocasae]|uniref:DNA ligase n=1 Tax=Nitrincola iocasae TaxID=2614693 RepID=UPI001E5FCAB2|nr:DNA ligase [Nitrincola iocasae]